MKVHALQRFLPILVGLSICSTAAGTASAQGITGVVIFPITTRGVDLAAEHLVSMKSYLATRLTMLQIGVMPESDLRRILEVLKIKSYDDCYDDACRIELGKALSADKTVSVEIWEEGLRCRITATMYDIRREVSAAAGDTLAGCSPTELRAGMAIIASQLKQGVSIFMRNQDAYSTPTVQESRITGQSGTGSIRVVRTTKSRSGLINPPEPPKMISRTSTEWFAMRFNGGNYGGGFEASLFTVRWNHFIWEIVRGGGNLFGPGFGSGSDAMGYTAYAGTAFGYPLHINKENKHEVRFMTGLFGGIFKQPLNNTGTHSWLYGNNSVGPFVLIEVCYVLHLKYNRALQTGISLMVPTYAVENDLPDPALHFFIGFRI